jgi:hypothetical protein
MMYDSVMNEESVVDDGQGPDWKRKTFSLPTSLADWVDRRATRGNASSYIAALIEADRHRELARQELRDFGYADDMEITEQGRAKARTVLDRHAASRASRERKRHVA